MIIGVGMDMVDIARVAGLLREESGDRFMRRILTEEEQQLAAGKRGRLAEFTAGRFAAKEAVVKALGCGIGRQAGFHDVSVLPDESGKPHCFLSEGARQRLGLGQDVVIHLSITHTDTMAAAYAVVERP
ncbi:MULTISPECIES: holo-ACP synthase [unclassified Paenibacillus]|uniref:holo-ACP synthase n=1 Tax=unclassified Paenibacillus TaxID=185978 RepID=UPI00020D6C2B|nr:MULTISPECIES: holo-ACP synthase [unclassified Paenibacillus]EGL15282.1 holo-[acyl-carrier-protein] synthase [Paenibacillus sp. HGF7]EPD88818.1 holo-[acyl-carrier-protein] synthase [Paenibacillus sp. HGH0039]